MKLSFKTGNLSLTKCFLTASVLLGLSLPATAQVLDADTSIEDTMKTYAGSSYKKQTVRYDHNGGYVSDPIMQTKCVNTLTQQIITAESPYVYSMAAPQERDFTSIVSGGDWLCHSRMKVSAWLGAHKWYSLRRCENFTIKTKGTSGVPRADITYSNCTEEGPTFYEHCDHSGFARVIGPGDFKLNGLEALGLSNDWLSSVKVPVGYEVDLFEHDNFEGRKVTLRSDDSCLVNKDFNDKMSSMKIRSIGPTVFEHCDYDGYGVALEPGSYTLAALQALGIKNNDLSSVKVPPGFEIELFDLDNFRGESKKLTSDDSCLRSNVYGFNDQTSSIIVRETL